MFEKLRRIFHLFISYFSDFSEAIISDRLTSSDHCGSDQGDGEAISMN